MQYKQSSVNVRRDTGSRTRSPHSMLASVWEYVTISWPFMVLGNGILAEDKKHAQVIRTLVPSQKHDKIDFNTEYPCPCRRKGQLIPITLTEAFGCDRCQQIFVVEDNGQVLEQLSTTYPYKRAWYWMGNSWRVVPTRLGESYLPIALGIIFVLVIIWLPLALRLANSSSIIAWAIVAVLLAILPALMVWLTYRR